jgi:hypothetical protein
LLFIPYLSVVGDALLHPIKLLIADLALRVALLQDFQSALRFLAAWAITAAPARAAASASAKHQVEREQHHPGYKDGKNTHAVLPEVLRSHGLASAYFVSLRFDVFWKRQSASSSSSRFLFGTRTPGSLIHAAHAHSLLIVPRHHLLHLLMHRLALFD